VLSSAADEAVRLSWWRRGQLPARAEERAIYLGPLRAAPGPGVQAFALDLAPLALEAEALAAGPGLRWRSGRELLFTDAADDDVTVAGTALAATRWHAAAAFDGRTGLATEPVEGGAKRQVRGGSGKLYPRTDPVAIGLIVSPDGRRCLLGRGRQHPEGMYTCLAGFVEQCEAAEEALRREALEEAGVRLGHVELVASQPWPIGRAGSCELMLGCRAVALEEALSVNGAELADARWFTRAEVRQMLQGLHPAGLRVPPPFAIAHHLIRDFAAPLGPAGGLWAPAAACLLGLVAGVLIARLRARP